jgi:hypothetical protein
VAIPRRASLPHLQPRGAAAVVRLARRSGPLSPPSDRKEDHNMTDAPKRIRLSRKKGWRKPDGAIVVARPTRWGNPFPVVDGDRGAAVEQYRAWLPTSGPDPAELRGRDLACWCPLDGPCHADVLLELANSPTEGQGRK